jgi:hypothetical protein
MKVQKVHRSLQKYIKVHKSIEITVMYSSKLEKKNLSFFTQWRDMEVAHPSLIITFLLADLYAQSNLDAVSALQSPHGELLRMISSPLSQFTGYSLTAVNLKMLLCCFFFFK